MVIGDAGGAVVAMEGGESSDGEWVSGDGGRSHGWCQVVVISMIGWGCQVAMSAAESADRDGVGGEAVAVVEGYNVIYACIFLF